MHRLQHSGPALPLACLLLLMAGLLLPWLVAPSASMTLSAYDLAEWVSLHPAQTRANPPLLASLLLRVQFVALCAATGCLPFGKGMRIGAALAIVLLAIAQLPPVEFVNDLGSLNYRQQFGCAIASLILGLGLLRSSGGPWRGWAAIAISVIGAATAVAGMSQALDVYRLVGGAGGIGAGLWLCIVAHLCAAGLGAREIRYS